MNVVKMKVVTKQIRGVSYKPTDLHDSLNSSSVILLRANNIDDGKINFDDVVYVDKSKVSKDQYLKKGDILICASSGSKQLVGKAASFDFDKECTFGAFCKVVRPDENVADYIGKYFQSVKYRSIISNVAIGANINNIRNEHIDSLELPMYSTEKANDIVHLLSKVQSIIEYRKQELSHLDDLIKARFVELFGNPLDKSKANKYFVECVEFNPKKSEVKDMMEEKVSFVPMECVGVDGSFKIREDGLVQDYYKGYTYFRDGDVLLAKITPCFENGKVAIAENCTNGIGFGTTEFHVSRPIDGVSNSYWIKYMLKNDLVHDLATINMTGSAGQKRIQTPFFEKLKIYLPPIDKQERFADFVKQVDKSKVIFMKIEDKLNMLY